MPPRRFSRHTFTSGVIEGQNNKLLTNRVPFRFRPFLDNRTHTVREGDTMFHIAGQNTRPDMNRSGVASFLPPMERVSWPVMVRSFVLSVPCTPSL